MIFSSTFLHAVTFSHVLHLDVLRRQIELKLKAKIEISLCMAIMQNHPLPSLYTQYYRTVWWNHYVMCICGHVMVNIVYNTVTTTSLNGGYVICHCASNIILIAFKHAIHLALMQYGETRWSLADQSLRIHNIIYNLLIPIGILNANQCNCYLRCIILHS